MEELVWTMNNEPVTDSRLIAEHLHKEHGKILRRIRKLRSQGCTEGFFIESRFRCEQNHQMFTNYFVTYDGFTLLFEGKDLNDELMRFVEAFQKAEQESDEPSCLVGSYDRRVRTWAKEESEREKLESKIKDLEKELAKTVPQILFVNTLLEKGDTISLQDMAKIITREDYDARTQAMTDWLHSHGHSLPDIGLSSNN